MIIVDTLKCRVLIVFWIVFNCCLASNIQPIEDIKISMQSEFVFKHMGLDISNQWLKNATTYEDDLTRTGDINHPGYYYNKPLGEVMAIDSTDVIFLKNFIIEYLNPKYYNDDIFNYLENFNVSFYDRKEFFFVVNSSGVELRFSGWYDEFIHIIIETDYSDENEFIERSKEFFNLPNLSVKQVSTHFNQANLQDTVTEHFFEYNNNNLSRFKLVGYTVLDAIPGLTNKLNKYTVLDLTIFTKELENEE